MIMAARVGYDAKVLLTMLDKIEISTSKYNNQHYRLDILTQRKKWARDFLRKTSLPANLFLKSERFKRYGKN
jgi:hypothetical protein